MILMRGQIWKRVGQRVCVGGEGGGPGWDVRADRKQKKTIWNIMLDDVESNIQKYSFLSMDTKITQELPSLTVNYGGVISLALSWCDDDVLACLLSCQKKKWHGTARNTRGGSRRYKQKKNSLGGERVKKKTKRWVSAVQSQSAV